MPILVNNMNILGLIESTSKNDSNTMKGNNNNTGTQFIEIPQLSEELIRSAVNGVSSKNNNSSNANTSSNNNNNNQSNNAANTTSSSMDDDPDSPLYGPDGKAKKAHSCPFCDRSFTRPYRLNDHISFSHTDERKYMCSMCSKNFSCKDKLKHHIDVKHDNKKPIIHHPKTRTKYRNTQDLRCEYPNCTKVFANKYNVKRHIENVHMKMRRRRHNHSKSGNRSGNSNSHNNTGNTSSSTLNSSLNTTANTTGNMSGSASAAAAAAAATLQLGIGNLATSLTSMSNLNLAGGHLTIAPKNYNGANNQATLLPTSSIIALPLGSANNSPLIGKPEPSMSSTPLSKKGRASQINHHQQQQQQHQSFQVANLNNSIQLASATPITAANANLVNLSLNPAQTATLLTNGLGGNNGQGGQNTPLTLVATSNGIGGITLTTLGSLHQQHHSQQAQFQQFQSQQPQQHQLVTNLANIGASGTILTLNGQPILIQQPSNHNNTNNAVQQQISTGGQHIIYQQQPTAILQPLGGAQSSSNKSNNLVINNNGIIGLAPSGAATTAADLLGNHILLANNSNSIQLSQNGGGGGGGGNNGNGGNLNAVAMAELVNSLLVKSENSSNVNNLLGSDGLINFGELTTASDNLGNGNDQQHTLHAVDFSNPSNNNNANNNGDHEQHNNHNDHLDEEKDNKIYTCARCPEIFNSSILLRKHVSESHEKGFVLYNIW